MARARRKSVSSGSSSNSTPRSRAANVRKCGSAAVRDVAGLCERSCSWGVVVLAAVVGTRSCWPGSGDRDGEGVGEGCRRGGGGGGAEDPAP